MILGGVLSQLVTAPIAAYKLIFQRVTWYQVLPARILRAHLIILTNGSGGLTANKYSFAQLVP